MIVETPYRQLKTTTHYKIFSMLRDNGLCTQEDLCKELRMPITRLNDSVGHLIRKAIVSSWLQDGNIVYTLNRRMLISSKKFCAECEFVKKRKAKFDDKVVRHYECKVENKAPVCHNQVYRQQWNTIKVLEVVGKRLGAARQHVKKIQDKGNVLKPIQEWGKNEFLIFFKELHSKYFPEQYDLNQTSIISTVLQLIKMFKEISPIHWAVLLKHCSLNYFQYCKENGKIGKVQSLLKNKDLYQNFIAYNEIGKKLSVMKLCREKKVYCPYWKSKCTLGQECSQSIVDIMQRKYN